MNKKKIVFLVSGNGGTLRFLFHAIRIFDLPFDITMVIADRDCAALQWAKNNQIECKIVNYSKNEDKELVEVLETVSADIIVTNIHKILTSRVLKSSSAEFVNLHYSLLPSFAGFIGMKTVEEARKQNCQFLGATCHEVTEKLDGGRILCQGVYTVDWCEPTEIIYDKVFRIACLCLLNGIMKKYYTNSYKFQDEFGIFNPKCLFDTSLLDTNFWEKVKMLS